MAVDEKDFPILDMRYKRIEDCEKDMNTVSKEYHGLDTRLVVLEHGQRINNWLTTAIAAGIIALVIKVFLGG